MKIPKSYKRVKRGRVKKGDMGKCTKDGCFCSGESFLGGWLGEKVEDVYGWEVYRKPKRYEVVYDIDDCFGNKLYSVQVMSTGRAIYPACSKHYAYKALKMLNGES